MATRTVNIKSLGEVSFQKRRGSRSIKLKLDVHGRPVVTLPYLVPYKFAEQFVLKHSDWIRAQQISQPPLADGQMVGRVHKLRFIYDASAKTPRSRVLASQVVITHNGQITDQVVQEAARKAAIRGLRREATNFLPKRLSDIARHEGYDYGGCKLKQLRGRWGSCDQNKQITLNIFLMQLPVELIDYVIYHELAHTRQLNHGAAFWDELESHLPDAKARRKRLKRYKPTVPA